MAEVVNPWCARPGLGGIGQIPSELLESVPDRRGSERRAAVGDEERIRLRDRMAPVPVPPVLTQGLDDGGVQRDQSRLVELGLADRESPLARVDVPQAQLQSLRDPQAGADEQADQRRVGPGPQAVGRRESPGRGQQRGQLGLRVDVGDGSTVGGAQEPLGWNLGRGVEDRAVAGEAADHLETLGPPGRLHRLREGRHASASSTLT